MKFAFVPSKKNNQTKQSKKSVDKSTQRKKYYLGNINNIDVLVLLCKREFKKVNKKVCC